jgi:nucleoside-diphosphate-sugar epimerase
LRHISILGCGWLGMNLATHLINNGHKVAGSTTSKSKLEKLLHLQIEAFQMQLPQQVAVAFFQKAEYLIIDIPPQTSAKGPDYHKTCIEAMLPYIKDHQKVIYVSATSVYPDDNQTIDEKNDLDKTSDRAKALIQVEELLRTTLGDRLTILRMGGLLGYDRIPGRYSAGKSIKGGNEKVNYIHRDDAIAIIAEIIKQQQWGLTLNVVAPRHPTRKAVYNSNVAAYNFEPTEFIDAQKDKKLRQISGIKLELLLDYSFIYPDPMHFYYTI